MISMFKKSLLALGFVFTSFILISAQTVSECKPQSKEIARIVSESKIQLKEIAQGLVANNIQNPKINSFIQASSDLSEEDLIDMCDQILFYRKELASKASAIENIKGELIGYLKSFVASGIDILEFDPNFAFIYNVQNPDFTVTFKNPVGEIRTRKYALNVKSIGLKFELVVKIDAIKILGSGFNYYDSMNKEYELGSGFDMGWYPYKSLSAAEKVANVASYEASLRDAGVPLYTPIAQWGLRRVQKGRKRFIGACLTFAKIKDTGCMLMIGAIAFGLGGSLITGTGIEGSIVTGGKMTPIAA
jgi:hypothetical protein